MSRKNFTSFNVGPMLTINPKDHSVPVFHSYLLGAVTPRPIALASTIDTNGNVNLSPFSFFNCFGSNPPLLIFSPSRRVRDNTTKHTNENILEVPEVVIHIVTHAMVQQVSLASAEYEKGINEFMKAGFKEVPSTMVSPPRVKESPVAMECKVRQVISTGEEGGAGNLIICEVLLMHITEDVIDDDGKIDPFKLDVVARLGQDYYARIQGETIFKVPRPLSESAIGIDNLPREIRDSNLLTGNDLGKLANVAKIPVSNIAHSIFSTVPVSTLEDDDSKVWIARQLLQDNRIEEAWQVLLYKKKDPA